ncbi:hypothetical protein QBC33DRAFT_180124 [Phialemonium atrogriseum]|uniref:Uncharacterized protein n=1 Tax=Phialemonium atrogriseum TaxID=1093897 RepID=A0AAJ0BW16_9PEZI|nr:uncharacterized protein QBC33DRAFT_180124 [Phialemonium atrogriseum]KAK1765032.1 hypothetical protein QBC33DRAFT_180124 [Phialemonium atrogriseum]
MDASPWLRSILAREDCVNNANTNTCEKPAASSKLTIAIVVGIGALFALVTVIVLVYLHFRRRRLDRREDALDHELSDYDDDADVIRGRPPPPPHYQQRQGPKKPAGAHPRGVDYFEQSDESVISGGGGGGPGRSPPRVRGGGDGQYGEGLDRR